MKTAAQLQLVENVLANSRDREVLQDVILYLGQRFNMGHNENSRLEIREIPGPTVVYQLFYLHRQYRCLDRPFLNDPMGETSEALRHIRSITGAFIDGRLWERN